MYYAAHILAERECSYIYRGQGQPKSFSGPGAWFDWSSLFLGKSYSKCWIEQDVETKQHL